MLSHSPTIGAISAKMVKVMQAVPSLEKDVKKAETGGLKYDYTSADYILSIIRPLLVEHGVAIFTSINTKQVDTRDKGWSALFDGSVTFSDSDSGEWVTVGFVGHATSNGSQALYIALTSAYKYVFLQNFAMDRMGEEVDSTENGNKDTDLTPKNVLYILAAGNSVVTTTKTTKVAEGKYRLDVVLPTPIGNLTGSVYAANLNFLTERDTDVYALKSKPDGTSMDTDYQVVLKLGTLPSTGAVVPALDVENTDRYHLSLGSL